MSVCRSTLCSFSRSDLACDGKRQKESRMCTDSALLSQESTSLCETFLVGERAKASRTQRDGNVCRAQHGRAVTKGHSCYKSSDFIAFIIRKDWIVSHRFFERQWGLGGYSRLSDTSPIVMTGWRNDGDRSDVWCVLTVLVHPKELEARTEESLVSW